ncbi:hypothetical protein CF327_g1127 [Tilletia walkeri]|uniref:trimethyllysine dioxygenase n=1 Tax=Tilletia walkeri TaxID=117179 RepID=A0A8X7T7U7_9BASI|nr:hypothetical protein CF327_g1127 [Tilletia walkeri]KAE8271694.1 hypothetical protein A4X09_0g641 [Tilletia walkeri]
MTSTSLRTTSALLFSRISPSAAVAATTTSKSRALAASSVPSQLRRHQHNLAQPPVPSTSRTSANQQRSLASLATTSPSAPAQQQSYPHLPSVAQHDRKVGITWASGLQSKYHNVWLRDHCRCPSCYHPTTKQRLLDTFSIPEGIRPDAIEATTEGLQVTWPAKPFLQQSTSSSSSQSNNDADQQPQQHQHISLYPWRWLMNNSYAPVLSRTTSPQPQGLGAGGEHERILWGRGIASAPPTVSYEDVMGSEEGVLKWCNKIAQYGFSFVSGVPATPEATQSLIERIAFIRPTHYGGFWDFTSNLAHGDTAYTTLALGAHTDTTYFTDPAGLQLFHLLSHGPAEGSKEGAPVEEVGPQGGESLLVDGFLAANVLREVHPDAYRTLSRVRVRTHSAGDEATLVRPLLGEGYPILQHEPRPALRRVDEFIPNTDLGSAASGGELATMKADEKGGAATTADVEDEFGELIMVRYNNDDRSTLRVPDEDVEPFYDALRKWHAILTSVEGEYWSQLVPGTALIFDNHRVLHGRAAFVGARRLCGAYVSHDDFRSRLSVLRAHYPSAETAVSSASAGADGNSDGSAKSSGSGTARYHRGVWDDAL